jgi:hypothetical protein
MATDIDNILKRFEKDLHDITKLGNSLIKARKDDDTLDFAKLQKKISHYLKKQLKQDGH